MIRLCSNQHISLVRANFNVGQLNKLHMYLCFFAFIPLGVCHSQKTNEESICCHSAPCLDKLKEMEGKPLTCITDHSVFNDACTMFWAPETAWCH